MFELAVTRRGRGCNFGGCRIEKDEKFFIQTQWAPGVKYPIKKNMCFKCAGNIIDDEFIAFLEHLASELKRAKNVLVKKRMRRNELKDVPF